MDGSATVTMRLSSAVMKSAAETTSSVRIFRTAAEGRRGDEALQAMGEAYDALLADRTWLLLQLQAYAACADDDVRELVRRRYASVYALVAELSGAEPMALHSFFAQGMLMNVAAAMDLPQLAEPNEGWLAWCRSAAQER
jgi:hypothetical protein